MKRIYFGVPSSHTAVAKSDCREITGVQLSIKHKVVHQQGVGTMDHINISSIGLTSYSLPYHFCTLFFLIFISVDVLTVGQHTVGREREQLARILQGCLFYVWR